jgi:hypothetical protein
MPPAYAVARSVAPKVAEHLRLHHANAPDVDQSAVDLLPGAEVIEALVDTAFWASVRREEGYVPKISLAFVPPLTEVSPLVFERPIPLDPTALTRLAAAVERPGIHLGVWPTFERPGDGQVADPAWLRGDVFADLQVWGTTHVIPPFCFVVEVIAPGLLVLKHRPRHASRKFINVAVLEGDRIKIVDETASRIADCPALLTSMIGFDTQITEDGSVGTLVQLALSMRKHGRGGILLVVPADGDAWAASIVQPVSYSVQPPYTELADLMSVGRGDTPTHEWTEAVGRAVDLIAGFTAVDGATIVTNRFEVLAFGAKIGRQHGAESVGDIMVSEPVEDSVTEWMHASKLGGTRHLSAAQFVHDQRDSLALVASQDGRFTIFAWSPCDNAVHAHRVETLLL